MQREERAVEQSRGHVEESKAKTLNTHRHKDKYMCIHTDTHSQADSVSMCTNNAKTTATVASDKSRQDFYTHSYTLAHTLAQPSKHSLRQAVTQNVTITTATRAQTVGEKKNSKRPKSTLRKDIKD